MRKAKQKMYRRFRAYSWYIRTDDTWFGSKFEVRYDEPKRSRK